MSATTPKPPYTFPQQRPTSESGDDDDHILRLEGSTGFYWRPKSELKDDDVWVPGCDQFFRDHGDKAGDVAFKMTCADRKWNT